VKIAVISDLHLGRGDRTDLFGHSDGVFLRFLRFLEHNFERIIMLGDTFETLAAKPWDQYREIGVISRAHAPLAARFNRAQYTMVHGNHDYVLRRLGHPDELLLEADGTRILFRHGHTFDWLYRNLRYLPEAFVWFGFFLARHGLRFVYNLGEATDRWFRRKGSQTEVSFRNWALGIAKAHEADIVVTAHTHQGGLAEGENGRLFLNSGTCSKGRFSWLSLDTKEGSYQHLNSW